MLFCISNRNGKKLIFLPKVCLRSFFKIIHATGACQIPVRSEIDISYHIQVHALGETLEADGPRKQEWSSNISLFFNKDTVLKTGTFA